MVDDFEVFVFQGMPALDQKTMRVVIAAGNIPQFPFGDQAAGNRARCAYNALPGIAFKRIGVKPQIDRHAVYVDLLADISGDNIGVITIFTQVIIFFFSGLIGQVKGFGQVIADNLIIGVKRKK